VVDKPAGVLCVSSDPDIPTLARSVYGAVDCEMESPGKMVVHRIGMETSGLIAFAKTKIAMRGMIPMFEKGKVRRHYEALLCGHVANNNGLIGLPLMRDYECPPFMRVSTPEHQGFMQTLDPLVVGRWVLQKPKDCATQYEVLSREEIGGHPVTRVLLTSISGR